MKMSSRRLGFKGSPITQHRPKDVDPPTRQRDQSLSVSLALSPLAIMEDPGLRGAAEAGKGRLVEDALKGLVATSHPTGVTHSLAGVNTCPSLVHRCLRPVPSSCPQSTPLTAPYLATLYSQAILGLLLSVIQDMYLDDTHKGREVFSDVTSHLCTLRPTSNAQVTASSTHSSRN